MEYKDNKDTVLIGKNIIEILTTGMYRNPLVIYREYIQNSADAINNAVSKKILSSTEEGEIFINIDNLEKSLLIDDNGTGLPNETVWKTLTSIAISGKDRTRDLGFRGIGRLAGLAYCEELIIETSHLNEDVKTVLKWDSVKLKQILNDKNNKQLASEVISNIASIEIIPGQDPNSHFFSVKLLNITNDKLLNIDDVKRYLNMVSPIKFNPRKFIFDVPIREGFTDRGTTLNSYNIIVNDERLFKSYNSVIYKIDQSKRKVDEITDINFHEILSREGERLAICWYAITRNMQLIPVANEFMGIRLRKGNIQVGDEYTFQRFFKDTRFHRYFAGEIHIIHDEIFPNGQRDYFDECSLLVDLENGFYKLTNTLQKLCRVASDINSSESKYENFIAKIQEFKEKSDTNDFLSPEHEQESERNIEEIKEKLIKNEEKIAKLDEKFSNDSDEVIRNFVGKRLGDRKSPNVSVITSENDGKNEKRKGHEKRYKSNRLSKLTKKEQKLVGDIYEVLRNVLTPDLVKVVIYKIEERFGLSNSSETEQ